MNTEMNYYQITFKCIASNFLESIIVDIDEWLWLDEDEIMENLTNDGYEVEEIVETQEISFQQKKYIKQDMYNMACL